MGSDAEYILRHSSVPVLLVRAAGASDQVWACSYAYTAVLQTIR